MSAFIPFLLLAVLLVSAAWPLRTGHVTARTAVDTYANTAFLLAFGVLLQSTQPPWLWWLLAVASAVLATTATVLWLRPQAPSSTPDDKHRSVISANAVVTTLITVGAIALLTTSFWG